MKDDEAAESGQGCELQLGPTRCRVFHLHPLQRCNLSCLHCYSDSSPQADAQLDREQALAAIRMAAQWGYGALSVSGGEPLLYPWLGDCLRQARELGMGTAIVSNGWLIDEAHAELLAALRLADTVALSVDGLSASHDSMRGRPRAFARVQQAMLRLAGMGIPFAVNCGVSSGNAGELDELAARVHECGACALQLHPIEASGRAARELAGELLTADEAEAFFVLAHLLAAEYEGRMGVHADVVHRDWVVERPGLVYGGDDDPRQWPQRAPAELLGVLVATPQGQLLPVCFGFAPPYALGWLGEEADALWRRYLDGGYARLRRLGRQLHAQLLRPDCTLPDVFNPSDLLARSSLQPLQ
jgi:pyruvate-formate lyase-activating enzyme